MQMIMTRSAFEPRSSRQRHAGAQQGVDILLSLSRIDPSPLLYPTSITDAAYLAARFMRAISLDTVLYSYLSVARSTAYINGSVPKCVDRRHLPRLLLATSAPNDYSWNYAANL